MEHADYARTLEEVERMLNDPETPLDPARVWSLLAGGRNHAPTSRPGGPYDKAVPEESASAQQATGNIIRRATSIPVSLGAMETGTKAD